MRRAVRTINFICMNSVQRWTGVGRDRALLADMPMGDVVEVAGENGNGGVAIGASHIVSLHDRHAQKREHNS